MKLVVLSTLLAMLAVVTRSAPAADATVAAKVAANPDSPLHQSMKTLAGNEVNPAEKYAGKVVLLVNVASRCGLTPQYKALQALYEKYKDRGLVVVGVPCNQFNGQEPGTAAEIAAFCSTNYGVTFDLLEKVEVNGDGACPLYKQLTSEEAHARFPGPIRWNFEKFVFSRRGEPIARFEPRTAPDAPEVIEVIEAALANE